MVLESFFVAGALPSQQRLRAENSIQIDSFEETFNLQDRKLQDSSLTFDLNGPNLNIETWMILNTGL